MRVLKCLLLFLLLVIAPVVNAQETSADYGWPRVFANAKDTVTVYQPQIDSWTNNLLKMRAAVSVTSEGNQVYGVLWLEAQTDVDKDNDNVFLTAIHTPKWSFPSVRDNGKQYLQLIQQFIPDTEVISLERLKSSLAITEALEERKESAIKNDPPQFFWSEKPALLVMVDGDPVKRQISGTEYSRVINSNTLILFDTDISTYYIPVYGSWVSSKKMEGPWTTVKSITKELNSVMKTCTAKDTSLEVFNEPTAEMKKMLAKGALPSMNVATKPTELIVTNGIPDYKPINGTNLLYVQNSDQDIFRSLDNNKLYFISAGRWYNSNSAAGPWNYTDPKMLPADFAKIPENHPKAGVLVSIPGTVQAQEAVIQNQIPQTATIDRENAKAEVEYDGSPVFEEIEGTKMEYAKNTRTPVIRADPFTYYAVYNGVWFTSRYATGPWIVAVSVPANIYTIPPSCPVYYVTYVRVYGYNSTVVYTGYTPGYYGCYISPYSTVVYGTGWVYRPWIGSYWYGAPCTWGMGVGFGWSSYSGWSINFGWGYRPVYRPWWGPGYYGPHYYPHYRGGYNYNAYHLHNPGTVRPRPDIRPNQTGRPTTYPTARPTTRPSGGNIQQPSTRPISPQQPTARPTTRPNNVYSDKDGNVYRPSNKGNWEQNKGNSWQPATNTGNLDREQRARNQGEMRSGSSNPGSNRSSGYRPAPSRPSPQPRSAPSGGRR